MAPPNQMAVQNAARGICLPDGSSEEVLASYAPAAVQQSQPCAAAAQVEGVSDESKGMSYARPVEVSRQPTHVFQANPVQSRQQRTIIVLGDALQFWINQQEAQGIPVDPLLIELAQVLHSGQLPDIHDEAFQILINQSLSDPALDAVLHSVALEVDTGPNRHLYSTALRYSLSYYLHQNPTNASDNPIRRSLIIALAHSTHSDSREILASSALGAPAETRNQVQLALNHAAQGGRTIISSGGDNLNGSRFLTISPAVSANQTAERLGVSSLVAALPQPVIQALQWANSHREEIVLGSAVLTGTTPLVLPVFTARFFPQAQLLISNAFQTYFVNPDLSTPTLHLRAHSMTAQPVSLDDCSRVSNLHFAETNPLIPPASLDPIALFDLAPRQMQGDSPYPALRYFGFSSFASQEILTTLPSPFLLGCVSIQGGIHQALSNAQMQAGSNIYIQPQSYGSAYRVAAISGSGAGSWEQDGFGEGSSQGNPHDQGRQGSQQDDQGHEEPAPLNPADVYLNHQL